jgi:hypothetical protein
MGWPKGQSGNPSGRKRTQWRKHFDAAIAADTEKHKQSIFEYAVEQARKDHTVLVAILRKCLPDLKVVDAQIEMESPFRLVITLPPLEPKPKQVKSCEKSKAGRKVIQERKSPIPLLATKSKGRSIAGTGQQENKDAN